MSNESSLTYSYSIGKLQEVEKYIATNESNVVLDKIEDLLTNAIKHNNICKEREENARKLKEDLFKEFT